MKHLKMLGLAAIAALGLMAFVGAGTASATTLSTDSAGTTKYAAGTEIHSTLKPGTSATLKNTSGETIATCTTSTVNGKIETATGTWVGGKINALTWGQKEGEPPAGECSQTTDTLVSEEVNDPPVTLYYGSLEIMQTTGDAGTVVGKGSKVTLSIFGVSCTYGPGEGTTLGTITGGTAPELAINATLPKIAGGFLCPGSGVWTANYIVTSPHALHIVS